MFFSLNAGLCSALLTNKTLRRRVEFAPQKLWCIGFFTVRAAPPTAFSLSVVLKTIFSVFAIFTLSLSLSSRLCLSGYHLQFNAYLGWALTIASPWNGPGPACMPNEVDVELFRSLSLYNIYLMQLHGSGLLERLKILLSLYKSHSIPPSTTY